MMSFRWALSALLVLAFGGVAQSYTEGYPFNQYKTYKFNQRECDLSERDPFDTGPWKASCRVTQLSHMINMGDTTIRKFVGLACGRGNTEDMAKYNARAHAQRLIAEMQSDDLKARGRQPETDQVYVSDNVKDYCVVTGSPRVAEREPDIPPPESPDHEPEPDPDPSPARSGPERDPNVAVFTLHNSDRYKLGVQFVSKTRSVAWPGNNRQYVLTHTGTYRLNCNRGEKICFGAWRDHQTKYWGVGRGNEGCQSCCIQCGGSMETTLRDAGADSFPSDRSRSGEADVLNGILQVVPGLIRPQQRPAPTPQYRSPARLSPGQAPRGRESGISGGSR